MPRTKLDRLGSKKPDKLLGLILAAKTQQGLTLEELAQMQNLSRVTLSRYLKQPTTEWLTTARKLCIALRVPEQDFREAIGY